MHKGQVLILAVLAGAVSTIIAHLHPFQADDFWSNWTELAIASAIGVVAPIVTAILLDHPIGWSWDRYGFIGQALGGLAVAMIGYVIVLMRTVGAESGHIQLVWTTFVLAMVGYAISALTGYLAER